MKNGQNAILFILVLSLGLFIFYILWVTPSERESLLGINRTVYGSGTNITITNQTVNKTLFTGTVGYVGRKTGKQIQSFKYDKVQLSYPLVGEYIQDKVNIALAANILFKGEMSIPLSGEYSLIRILGTISNVVGTPVLEISSGNSVISKSQILKNQELDVIINSSKVFNDKINIICQFYGLKLWEQQKCEINNLSVIRQDYKKVSTVQSFELKDVSNETGGEVKIYFAVDGSNNGGSLKIRINDVNIYDANPAPRDTRYFARSDMDSLDFVQGINILELSVDKGGEYNLSNIEVNTFERETEATSFMQYFTIPKNVYVQAKSYLLSFEIEGIIDKGAMDVLFDKIGYFFSPEQLTEGKNLLTVKKEDLSEGVNRIKLQSSTGRFKITQINLIWE